MNNNAFSKRLQIDYVDDSDLDDGEKQELRFKGIQEVQINVPEKISLRSQNVFMAISVGYSAKREVFTNVQSTANLEYELPQQIVKVTTKDAKNVGFDGHNKFDIKRAGQ